MRSCKFCLIPVRAVPTDVLADVDGIRRPIILINPAAIARKREKKRRRKGDAARFYGAGASGTAAFLGRPGGRSV